MSEKIRRYTFLPTTIQQLSFVQCFATSSLVYVFMLEEKNEERTDSRNRADFRRAKSHIETGIHECGIFLQR